jgi:ABC-type sugar transport system permease subunit
MKGKPRQILITITATMAQPLSLKSPFQPLPYLLLLPSLAIIFIIEFYPFINGVSFSFHKGTLLGSGAFVGLNNYLRLFNSPIFYNSLWFSFIFAYRKWLLLLGLVIVFIVNFPIITVAL